MKAKISRYPDLCLYYFQAFTQPSQPCTTCTGCPANWRDGWISESVVGFEPTNISFADWSLKPLGYTDIK